MARAAFYLLLAYLAAGVASGWAGRGSQQANAHGALATAAGVPGGKLVLFLAAVGFAAFALLRFAGAYADREVGVGRRLTTAGQAVFYLAMAGAVVSFLLGDQQAGSTQRQSSTVMELVGSPLGRLSLAAAGALVLCVCAWQVRLAIVGGFADSLVTEGLSPRKRAALHRVGQVGIVARAAAVVPVGGLLILAAILARARTSRDLDQLLQTLADDPAGRPLVWLAAGGLLVFALYSLAEARFRAVHAGN